MTAYLLILLIYANGTRQATVYPKPSIEVCSEQLPAYRAAAQAVSDENPGALRMFAISCSETEYFKTKDRT